MATLELDPVFVRALRLLHSKSKDSTSQLKCMLDEAIRHRKGLGPGPTGFSPASPQRKREERKDAEKRSLDKLKHELAELVPTKVSSGFDMHKRPRLDSPSSAGFSSKSHTPSPTPPGSRGEMEKNSSSGGNSSEADEMMDLDMNLEGLNDCTCWVCKSFNQENGNKLMECHTCQNLFHQGCHEPPVPNEEALDPRLVWNCTDCIKKQPTLKPTAIGKGGGGGHSGLNMLKASSKASPSKSDMTGSSSIYKKDKGNGGGGKPSGMSALAASYKSASSSSKSSSRSSRSSSSTPSAKVASASSSSSSSSSSSQASSSTTGAMTADRRIQMMKKKAAAARKMK